MSKIDNGVVVIKKQDSNIFYSVSDDHTHYFDLESLELHHPELHDYLEHNRSILERKMLQFREQYGLEGVFTK